MTIDLLQQAAAYRALMETLASGVGFEAVAGETARWAMALCEAEGATVCRRRGDDLLYIAALGSAASLQGETTPMATSFTGGVIQSREARIFAPARASIGSRQRAQRHQIQSGIVVPFLVGEAAVGALGVVSGEPDRFDESHRELLDSLGKYVAIGVERLEARRDFHRLLEATPDGVAILREGRLIYANQALAAILAAPSQGALQGAELGDFVEPEELPALRRWLEGEPEATPLRELRLLRADRRPAVVELSQAEEVIFEGTPGRLVVIRDVTERAMVELQLQQADRLANIGVLAAGIMHEVNNPLTYLMANLDLAAKLAGRGDLREEGLEELLGLLEDAADGAHRVRDTVDSLRAFARADRPSRGPVALGRVLAAATKMARSSIRHAAELQVDIDGAPLVRGDEVQLVQVFLNILSNALQAVEAVEGTRRVAIRWLDLGPEVAVEVVDSGPGIAPEGLDRIFEPFFSTKARGEGTGIGLSLSRKLVESMEGRIEVASTLGEGSCFRVVLRRGGDDAAVAGRASRRSALPSKLGSVLVVDDERLILRSLRRLLGGGRRVTLAASGHEAQRLLEGGAEFDLILCDMMMPGFTGAELYEWIARERPSLIDRLIFMTGGAVTKEAKAFLDRPRVALLRKPFDEQELYECLARRLEPDAA